MHGQYLMDDIRDRLYITRSTRAKATLYSYMLHGIGGRAHHAEHSDAFAHINLNVWRILFRFTCHSQRE